MIIEDKVPDNERIQYKVNNNLIYLVDYEIQLIKITNTKIGKRKSSRVVKLIDELHENNPGEHNKKFYEYSLRRKVNATEKEIMEIKKVILKKEISCSFYER